ncbi:MAG: hypothetical protein CMJ18_15925 [Phycisphaeraceae bacterium]|nr:hypothetical protein [Phycisphaeraceae bacterium]
MNATLRQTRRWLGRLAPRRRPWSALRRASEDYQVVTADAARAITGDDCWASDDVADRQEASYRKLLADMYAGRPRSDLAAAGDAIRRTQLAAPRVLETGCGSGYYGQVLEHLLDGAVDYVGVDTSPAMIRLARRRRPALQFAVADAVRLPLPAQSFDVVLNGVCLMHILDYEDAIHEAARVAGPWCIYHTVPTLRERATTYLCKRAYGRITTEVIFNEQELIGLIADTGFSVDHVQDSVPYDLQRVLGEPTFSRTYLCRRLASEGGRHGA